MKPLGRRDRGIAAGDKARDRSGSVGPVEGAQRRLRSQGPVAAPMGFIDGLHWMWRSVDPVGTTPGRSVGAAEPSHGRPQHRSMRQDQSSITARQQGARK